MAKRTTKRTEPRAASPASPAAAKATQSRQAGPAVKSAPKPRAPRAAKAAEGGYEPTFEEIATRAYFRHLERGGTSGNEMGDWLAAETELRVMHAAATRASARSRRAPAWKDGSSAD
jgi:hypothetical protein